MHMSICIYTYIFQRRLTRLFLPYDRDFGGSILLHECSGILKKCRTADAVKIISERYDNNEDFIFPCLLGRMHKADELQHYPN